MNSEDDNIVNFAIDPTFYIKIQDTIFGVDKKLLIDNSDVLKKVIFDLDNGENIIDLSNDNSLKSKAFTVVMMFYYTPWWCTFNLSKEHFPYIWDIVYISYKYNFTKMFSELEKYLITNCNYYFETLKVASYYNLKNLRMKCISYLTTTHISEDKLDGIKDVTTDDLIAIIKNYNNLNKKK
jgi:hypothetical protein